MAPAAFVFYFAILGILATAYPAEFAWVTVLILASQLLTRR